MIANSVRNNLQAESSRRNVDVFGCELRRMHHSAARCSNMSHCGDVTSSAGKLTAYEANALLVEKRPQVMAVCCVWHVTCHFPDF